MVIFGALSRENSVPAPFGSSQIISKRLFLLTPRTFGAILTTDAVYTMVIVSVTELSTFTLEMVPRFKSNWRSMPFGAPPTVESTSVPMSPEKAPKEDVTSGEEAVMLSICTNANP